MWNHGKIEKEEKEEQDNPKVKTIHEKIIINILSSQDFWIIEEIDNRDTRDSEPMRIDQR